MKLTTQTILCSFIFFYSCSILKHHNKSGFLNETGMEYVKVCDQHQNCKNFSRLIMGTDHLIQGNWTYNGQKASGSAQVNNILDEAVRLGINIFDTSPIYVGNVEKHLGKWIESREKVIISDNFYINQKLNPDRKLYTISKGGFPHDLFYHKELLPGTHSLELKNALSKHKILQRKSVSASSTPIKLNNPPPGTYSSRLFGTEEQIKRRVSSEIGDTVNNLGKNLTVYLLHRDDADFFKFIKINRPQNSVLNIASAIGSKELSSKFQFFGVSNWKTPRIVKALKLSKNNPSLPKAVLSSSYFSLFEMSNRSIHAGGVQVTHYEMMDPDFQKGIKLMPYSPLGGFSILDKPRPRWENGKKAAKEKLEQGNPYWKNVFHSIFTDANHARYIRAKKFLKQFNVNNKTNYTLDQLLNAYVLAHNRTDFLTIGPITIEQLRRTVASLKLAKLLSKDDLEYLYSGN